MLSLFGKKKNQPSPAENPAENQEPIVLSKLQEITAGDDEMYRSLSLLFFLYTKKIITSFEEAGGHGATFCSAENTTRAGGSERVLGRVVLYPRGHDSGRETFEQDS